jgi:glycerol-3-phosphate dehydrogenase
MAHHYFSRHEFSRRFPALDTAGLKGGFTYGDAQTDDARLVLELIGGAMAAGAVCVNYCRLSGLAEHQGQVNAATVQDQLSGASAEVHARQIVYAAGQWAAAAQESSEWCRVSKGVHLVMPALLADEALLLTSKSDGRVFFMIPWYGITLIGTTDTDYSGDMNHVVVEEQEVAYLLDAANHYLRTAWTTTEVIGRFAGLRVMKRSEKSSPSAVSRDWELKTAHNGVHYSTKYARNLDWIFLAPAAAGYSPGRQQKIMPLGLLMSALRQTNFISIRKVQSGSSAATASG